MLEDYGVTLNVGRGYDGWSSIHTAAERFEGQKVTVLYYGDFDPSGDDMVRSLRERLGQLGSFPAIIKVALSMDDVTRYNLPPNLTKPTDSRQAAFVEKNGDVSVELDALEPAILRARLIEAVEAFMNMDTLKSVQEQEKNEREKLVEAFNTIGG